MTTQPTKLCAWVSALMLFWSIGAAAVPHTPRSDKELSAAWQDYLKEQSDARPTTEFPFQHCFETAAETHDLPLSLLLAVARGESDFNPRAKSSANAHGLMQILWPITARHLGFTHLSELYDPCRNVDAGARYLKELMQRYSGNLHLALAAYNYGPGRIRIGAQRLPDGARWYSAYINRHLAYVLTRSEPVAPGELPKRYSDEAKLPLIVFTRPYRAEAFVDTMKRLVPEVRLDWFREDSQTFQVVLMHADEAEATRSQQALRNVGFVSATK